MTWHIERPGPRPRRAWALDVLVASGVALFGLPSAVHSPVSATVGVPVLLLLAAIVLPRRLYPVPVFTAAVLAAAVLALLDVPLTGGPAVLVALHTVAVLRPRREALIAAAVAELGVIFPLVQVHGANLYASLISISALVAAATGVGLYRNTRRTYLLELTDRAARLERERDQQAALATAAERARIAREMHDIVAHHLTVMVALSDGAAAAAAASPERAADTMRTVSATGREALADTRRLLGVLREDVAGDAPLAPVPTMSGLDELLARVRSAGLPVRYEVGGAPRPLPPGVQLAMYRLVQESLTNTMKHGGAGASALVTVRYGADRVDVEVTDDGAGARTPVGVGRGISGMRERVQAYGGTVETGPREQGGWRVVAQFAEVAT